MTIGAGLLLIAVGGNPQVWDLDRIYAWHRCHTIGDMLMIIGAIGVLLWLVMWAPWARSRRAAYRRPEPPEEVVTTRRYPADDPYEDGYRY